MVYPNIEGSIKEGKYNTSTKDGNNLNFGTCDVVYVTMQKPIAVENDIEIRPSEYDIDITKLVEYISKV